MLSIVNVIIQCKHLHLEMPPDYLILLSALSIATQVCIRV